MSSKKRAPEQLVLGARLRCSHGSQESILWVEPNGLIEINHVPQATVDDCVPRVNILPFGLCDLGGYAGGCAGGMEFEGPWENLEPQGILVNGKEAITVNSQLVCKRSGFSLSVESSGQDNIFVSWLVFQSEMESKYPGLRAILDDPDGSLYLNEGMYEKALQFLEDEMQANGGEIDLDLVNDKDSPEGYYIKSAIGHLEPAVNTENKGTISDGMDAVVGRYEESVREEVDVHYLNPAMMKLLKRDCKENDRLIRSGGFYRWQEENKEGLRLMAEWMREAEFSALMAAGMMGSLTKAQRSERYTEEVRENLSEGKSVAKGAGRTNHSPKIKDAKFKEGGSGSNKIDDVLKGAKETTNNAGVARNFEKYGGFEKTLEDFNTLNPTNVKGIQTQYGPGKVGKLSDGTTIVARPGSKTGGATLEIKVSNSKVYKVRY